ncbi:MAG: OmpH family outer membrane protein [Victivallales bacterium]|nr:OmpH family outer membrane protein [Victivallales bacterium]
MKRIVFAIAAVAVSLMSQAQDRVAYVSMEKAFAEFYKTINANVQFEQKKLDFEEQMTALSKDLETAAAELKNLKADAENELLSKEARDEAARKFKARVSLFEERRNEMAMKERSGRNELNRLKGETEATLVKDLMAAIKKFAADNGYTHVYDISGMSFNRMPVLLVYPEQHEVTPTFINVINNGHEKELEAAKEKLEIIKNTKVEK